MSQRKKNPIISKKKYEKEILCNQWTYSRRCFAKGLSMFFHLLQGCKMDCENCDNCEIANCDCEKNTISQITQFSFLSAGRNRNTTQFDFLEGRNCEIAKNCEIGEKTIFVSRI